jgi:hypothetical protein
VIWVLYTIRDPGYHAIVKLCVVIGAVFLVADGIACSSGHGGAPPHNYPDAGPPAPLGAPLEGVQGSWTWNDFPDSRCRDGSSTGVAVRPSGASKNAVVFLDQGGACFNGLTCLGNPSSFGAADFGSPVQGIFNQTDPDNPVRDWSFVYVPYCTGDVHAGTRKDGMIAGDGAEQFVGYSNLDLFLARIVPTFADASQILLVGSSAGGFGVLLDADRVSQWFSPIPVTVVSDSGPPMPSSLVAPCLQQLWNDTWGMAQGPLADCAADCPHSNDYMLDQLVHFGWRYPSYRTGLISSAQDATISFFFSFGLSNCTGAGSLSPADYQNGLLAVRARAQNEGTPFATFFIGGDTRHIWLMSDAMYATTVNGVSMKRWLADILGGTMDTVGP